MGQWNIVAGVSNTYGGSMPKKASWLKTAISPECIGKVGGKQGKSLMGAKLADWNGVCILVKSRDKRGNMYVLIDRVKIPWWYQGVEMDW